MELPYAGEHPCFGQQQEWACTNMATWRMEGQFVMLHWCEACKTRVSPGWNDVTWTPMDKRPAEDVARIKREHAKLTEPGLAALLDLGGLGPDALPKGPCQCAVCKLETEAEREERIHNDVFKPGESDLEYFQRRQKELGQDPKRN